MALKRNGFVGIAAGEKSFLIAEIFLNGRSVKVRHAGEWHLPGVLSDAESQGKALKNFLRSRRISSMNAVVGIPAKWLLAKEKSVPRVDAETLANLLRLEAEKDFALSPGELVLDYVKGADNENNSSEGRLLLLAAHKGRMEFVCRVASAAGLRVAAVLPVSLAVSDMSGGFKNFVALYLGRESAEAAVYSGGKVVAIRHLGMFEAAGERQNGGVSEKLLEAISSGIRRMLMLLPESGNSDTPSKIIIMDDHGFANTDKDYLKSFFPDSFEVSEPVFSVGAPVKCSGSSLPCNAAVVLAEYAGRPGEIPVNFIRSRMAPRKTFRLRKAFVKIASLAAVLILAVISGMADLRSRKAEVANIRAGIDSISTEFNMAKSVLDYTSSMRGWRGEKIVFLECLREITLAFPVEGRIWVTSMAIRDDMRGLVSGKAVDSKTVLELLEKLKRNKAFSGENLLYIRHAGGDAEDVVYAVSFLFRGDPVMDKTPRGNNQ